MFMSLILIFNLYHQEKIILILYHEMAINVFVLLDIFFQIAVNTNSYQYVIATNTNVNKI